MWKTKVKRKPFTSPKPEKRIRYREAGQWGNFDRFKFRYCDTEQVTFVKGGRERTVRKVIGPKRSMMAELNQRLLDFGMIRWRRADVLALEPIVYEHIALQPTPEQESIYNQLKAGFIDTWGDDGLPLERKSITNILAQLLYFRRATTLTPREFNLSLQGRNPEFAPSLRTGTSDRGAKQEWLLEFLQTQLEQDGNGDKFLIFCDWTSELRPLLQRIASRLKLDILSDSKGQLVPSGTVSNPTGLCSIIDGNTPHQSRQQISERWNSDPQFKVFLGSPAAFEGINMQGGIKKDDTAFVVILNMPWLPKDVIQAIGRAWRYGQDGHVMVLFPSVDGTIDESMTDTVKQKQGAFDLAIDGGQHNMADLFVVTSAKTALNLIG